MEALLLQWPWKIESVVRVLIPDEVVCISLRTNALEKGINPSLLFLAMSK